jgi:hypothetical protein
MDVKKIRSKKKNMGRITKTYVAKKSEERGQMFASFTN